MIRIISYTRLLILVLSVGVLFGCNSDIVEQKRQAESRYIRINGYPKGFSEVEVSTRSGKNEFETKLSTLYMLIFDANGRLVDVPQFIASGVPDFLIDTHSPSFVNHDQQALRQCDIFLVGNLNNGDLAGIRSLTELYNFEVEATTIHPDADPSFKGLVMIGQTQEKVDLSLARPSTSNNIQDIFMVSIYAKVVVNLQIRPEEHLPGNDQSFRMISWEVVNARAMQLSVRPMLPMKPHLRMVIRYLPVLRDYTPVPTRWGSPNPCPIPFICWSTSAIS